MGGKRQAIQDHAEAKVSGIVLVILQAGRSPGYSPAYVEDRCKVEAPDSASSEKLHTDQ
jgi:hypothetical protein